MSIFYKSILKEYTATWLVIFASMLFVIVTTQVVRYIGYAADGTLPLNFVLVFLLLGSVRNLPVIISFSIVLTVIVCLNRCYRDSEMVIWLTSGRDTSSWVGPTAVFSFPLVLLTALLSFYVAPWAEKTAEDQKQELKMNEDVTSISPGVFVESKNGDAVFFVDRVDQSSRTFEGVLIFSGTGTETSVLSANKGRQEDSPSDASYLVAEDGFRYTDFIRSKNFDLMTFEEYGIRIDRKVAKKPWVHHSGRTTRSLIDEGSPVSDSELVWRFGLPISGLVLALLSIPISFVNVRGGKSYSIAIGILMFMTYKNVLGIVQIKVAQSSWSFWEGMLVPHALTLVIFLFLLVARSGILRALMVRRITA